MTKILYRKCRIKGKIYESERLDISAMATFLTRHKIMEGKEILSLFVLLGRIMKIIFKKGFPAQGTQVFVPFHCY